MAHHSLLTFLSLSGNLSLSYRATWCPMPQETLQSCHGDGCQAQFVVRVQLLRKAYPLLYPFGWCVYINIYLFIYIYIHIIHTYNKHIYTYRPTVPKGSVIHLTMVMGRLPSNWNGFFISKFSALPVKNKSSRIIRTLSKNICPRQKVQLKRKHTFGKLDYTYVICFFTDVWVCSSSAVFAQKWGSRVLIATKKTGVPDTFDWLFNRDPYNSYL